MIKRITFKDNGLSRTVNMDGSAIEGNADCYEVEHSSSERYFFNNGNPIPATDDQVEEERQSQMTYLQKRQEAYGIIGNELDMIFKSIKELAGDNPGVKTSEYISFIQGIKDSFPKDGNE